VAQEPGLRKQMRHSLLNIPIIGANDPLTGDDDDIPPRFDQRQMRPCRMSKQAPCAIANNRIADPFACRKTNTSPIEIVLAPAEDNLAIGPTTPPISHPPKVGGSPQTVLPR
jgi:hypothetical protein